MHGRSPTGLEVVLGDHNTRRKDKGEVRKPVCNIHVHNFYASQHISHDVAILKLCSPVVTSAVIQPISMASRAALFSSQPVTVAGWGTQREGGRVSKILRFVKVEVIPHGTCRRAYPWVDKDDQLCAGIPNGGKDSCQGDSGGPLWRTNPRTHAPELVGIVSNGRGCARPGYPGVYTRVATYHFWILDCMAKL